MVEGYLLKNGDNYLCVTTEDAEQLEESWLTHEFIMHGLIRLYGAIPIVYISWDKLNPTGIPMTLAGAWRILDDLLNAPIWR